jgi:nucleotide-binding universal stress UspA family protein
LALKVLIAIDSSDASQHVLAEAAVRPWPAGTAFTLINVVDVYGLTRLPGLVEEGRRLGLALVNAASAKLSQAGYKASAEVLLGTPRREIAEYAKRWSADLLIVGSHGQGAIARFLMGSVAQGVLHTAPCSVEVVRARASSAVASSRAMKILLATDGSEFSTAAAKSVASRPWPAGSEIRLFSVEELPAILPNQMTGSSLSAMYPASLLEELLESARTHAREAVDSARTILRGSSLRVLDSGANPLGDARVLILDEAKEWKADLIVLGSHGRRGLDRMLMGSVSESVALHAQCSVEVIRLQSA